MRNHLFRLLNLKLLIFLLLCSTPFLDYGQQVYVLTDNDIIVENGVIVGCSYDFSVSDIVIPEQINGQQIIGIANRTYSTGIFSNKGLTSVQFPSSIRFIGKFNFRNNNIDSINFSDLVNLELIGEYSFSTNSLIILDLSNCIKLKTIERYAFNSNTIENIILPTNPQLQFIEEEAFKRNKLKGIDLQNCNLLRKIGKEAFLYNNFSKFTLPVYSSSNAEFFGWFNGADTLSGGAIANNLALTYTAIIKSSYIPLPEELEVVNGVLIDHFIDFDENPEIVLPENCDGQIIKEIGYKAFANSAIKSIVLPSTIVTINNNAFSGCQNLVQLDLSKCSNLKSIGKSSFSSCKINELNFNACFKLEEIGEYAFSQNNTKKNDFSNCFSLKSIGAYAFNNNQFNSIDFSECSSLIYIGSGSFADGTLPGFSLPIPTIDGNIVEEWLFGDDKKINSGSFVSDYSKEYRAVVTSVMYLILQNQLFFTDVDRGKYKYDIFQISNLSTDTLKIDQVVLKKPFVINNLPEYILPHSTVGVSVRFDAMENIDYQGELIITFVGSDTQNLIKLCGFVKPNYDLKFIINDENGFALDANVTIDESLTKTTDSKGEVLFENIPPSNSLSYSVSTLGYYDVTGSFILNNHITEIIEMKKIGVDVKIVVSNYDSLLEDVVVTLSNYGDLITNEEGFVTFHDVLPADSLICTAYKEGFLRHEGFISISDQNSEINIELLVERYTIRFICTDQLSNPLVGVSVDFGLYGIKETNQDGISVFSDIDSGEKYIYNILKDGYITIIDSITIQNKSVDITVIMMPELYSISFNVSSENIPLHNVEVSLLGVVTKTTDDNGLVVFEGLHNGSHFEYRVNSSGFIEQTGEVIIDNSDVFIDISLLQDKTSAFSSMRPKTEIYLHLSGQSIIVNNAFNKPIRILNIQGQVLFSQMALSDYEVINIEYLNKGICFVIVDELTQKILISE